MKGFTLIELLVSISIIAIMATVGMVVYGTVQKQGRMAKRIEDLKAISTALEAYKQSNGSYPYSGGNWKGTNCGYNTGVTGPNDTVPGLAPTYMTTFPQDPQFNTNLPNNFCYLYISIPTSSTTPQDYKMIDYSLPSYEFTTSDLNNPGYSQYIDPKRTDTVNCTPNNASRALAVYTLGARCL